MLPSNNKLLIFRAIVLTIAVAPFGCSAAENVGEEKPATALTSEGKPAAIQETKETPAIEPEDNDPNLPSSLAKDKALKRELENLRFEKSLIDARLALEDAKRKEAESQLAAEKAKLDIERALQDARSAASFAELDKEKSKIERELALDTAKANRALAEKNSQLRALETEAKIFKMELDQTLAKYSAATAVFQKEREASKISATAPKYLKEPLVEGTLYISDRRISLNGTVTPVMADNIITQVNFFNNQSTEYPIFLVIDNSPGGSVSAGFQILKAMESSQAPVYVVVKGFAASMAAVITTLAERSYCYNNTLILHHQMLTTLMGNMSMLKENLEFANQWYDRLATPVAKKMGLTLEEFTKQMYAHTVTGDWREFGENAQKLKWVDTVVERIEETSIRALEELKQEPPRPGLRGEATNVFNDCTHKVDEQGRPYIQLPVLENPYDVWWLYDRRGLYRAQ